MLITFFTFVYKTGAARRSDNPQTKKTPLLRLVMVHRDLDFIGKTITINLKVENKYCERGNNYYERCE